MTTTYDFLVIGGGPGGTPAAMALAQAGRRVLLVEQGAGLGGTCLFEGCIPSKILRESARRLREIREAIDFGLCLPSADIKVDWYAIQQRKRDILQQRSQAALQRVEQLATLDLILGKATLSSPTQARIVDQTGQSHDIEFAQAIVSTGSVPSRPSIPGVDHHRVLDSEAILDIDEIPAQLVVIGGGPIGVELGQIFKTFGSEVTLLEAAPRILGPVDEALAEQLEQRMRDDGIEIHTSCQVKRIDNTGGGVFVEFTDASGNADHRFAEKVLLVTGRHPNVDGLGLEQTQIQYGPHGIAVDAQLRTHEPNIYAVGDVIGHPMFAHWATAQGLALARHLLGQPVQFPDPRHNSAVIFSEPELAMAGMTEAQAREAGLAVATAGYDFAQDARAQIAGRAAGQLKLVFDSNSHEILGVHVLAEGADDLMGEAALAVKTGMTLEAIAASIHPHPTLTESFVQAARMALARKKQL